MLQLADIVDIVGPAAVSLGVVTAVIAILSIPSMRKTVIRSYKIGQQSGQRAAGRLTGSPVPRSPTPHQPEAAEGLKCPKCGSRRFRIAHPTQPVGKTGFAQLYRLEDRICKDCGTLYRPKIPRAMKIMLLFVGVFTLGFGIVGLFQDEILTGVGCLVAGAAMLVFAWTSSQE